MCQFMAIRGIRSRIGIPNNVMIQNNLKISVEGMAVKDDSFLMKSLIFFCGYYKSIVKVLNDHSQFPVNTTFPTG